MTDDQAIACVAVLVAAFPETVVGTETLTLYGRFLRDVDEQLAASAIATWIARERRFPHIADLRAQVDTLRGTAPPDLDQAWSEAMQAARRGRAPTRWSHEAVRLAVEAVGFNELRMTDTPGVERAHFGKAYEAARRRVADAGCAQLAASVAPEMLELMAAPSRANAQIEGNHVKMRAWISDGKKKGGK